MSEVILYHKYGVLEVELTRYHGVIANSTGKHKWAREKNYFLPDKRREKIHFTGQKREKLLFTGQRKKIVTLLGQERLRWGLQR